MNLFDAFDYVASFRETWKTPNGSWRKPFIYNRAHILRILGTDKNVKKIQKGDLAAMRTTLQREGRSNGGINRIMSMLNTVLKELVDNEIIDKQPRLKPLKEDNARQEYFSRRNVEDMVTAAREVFINHELADAILFGVYTGCRRANLLELEVQHVNLVHNHITFVKTKQGEAYTVDIHPELKEMLTVRCANEKEGTKVFHFKNADELWTGFKKVRNYIGLSSKYVWHSLRHTTGTWLAEKGVPIQTIAKVLGHKTLEMSQRYTKITDQARQSAINSL